MGDKIFLGKSVMDKTLVFLLILFCIGGVLQSQTNVEMQHKGKIFEVPSAFIDPAFPKADAGSDEYQAYVSTHLFPLPEEGDYERRLERWVMNNRYFPQFLSTGNAKQDSVRYSMGVEVWKQKNPDAVVYIAGKMNTTSLSDEDFQILFNSFPRKKNTGNAESDQRRYEEEVLEWIRIYSYEKYELIEPLVREAELLNKKEGEVK
ncbi:MAG: hypothetical protein CVU11_03225 [Bacteroidetes bacterium HGW-Bacteroidetes-6]|jgi:hypothetical protein|nr:MAG: hypothetical protein CVU11_03225 [Bacteroidetes bacterium HGW-Bacteroidetes-6]